ncbi:response regulator [Opitutus terrae]|uniref:Two component transcriptional regulator, winged helix family n=1 Tax=Opitutus terrae (strain DSM 11246 / JCM 15787 / PB90-1) TaxID=452637 RepID=B1ZQC8_OPITP|nr:response regulator transcription factor [Opitutus terrae]ACB73608.1 two component transcriptional regulator, winged helix family [Opitutus terrae PB90-1]
MTPSSPRSAKRRPDPTRVLIIDDDERLTALLTEYLRRFGFTVRAAAHPRDGLRALKADPPDLVILDVMLPDTDGLAVCREVRADSRIPIIMLTARGDVTDRIVGLEMGADDYLPKPFEPRELVARIQAVLRRGTRDDAEALRLGALEVNWTTRSVRLAQRELELTTAEFELLGYLARNRGRVMSRDRILDGTRGIDWDAYDRSIDILVSRLRQKLGDDPKRPTFIRTVRGVGYSFIGGGRE